MAAPLKHILNADVVRAIATQLRRVHRGFDAPAFVKAGVQGLEALELTPRGWHIALALRRYLPEAFPAAAEVLIASLGPELEGTEELGLAPFHYLPHVFYVARYGLDHFEPAMRAQHELTRRFTAEFSIRAYLERHPERTLERLSRWASDPSPHVRRLVSEGTRPRLPWAPRLRAFQQDPAPVLALLERLKDDPERYVQRSVANNLNDIGKDHPDVAAAVCRRWAEGGGEGRQWIVRHALRSLVKQGHRGALATLGVAGAAEVKVHALVLPRRVRLGGELRFSLELENAGRTTSELLVDYAVHFVKASGETRPKVFKLKRLTLAPRARAGLAGKVSFAPMTTRQARPGRHTLELRVNGVTLPLGGFDVVA